MNMTNNQLADMLDAIAQNKTFSSAALLAAYKHNVSTSNDCAMLTRYIHGCPTGTDHIRLQELANYIREVE